MAEQGYAHLLEKANIWALSAVLNVTMPIGVVEEELVMNNNLNIGKLNNFLRAANPRDQIHDDPFMRVFTGSRPQGLAVPAYRRDGDNSMSICDIDYMWVHSNQLVGNKDESNKEICQADVLLGNVETINTRPGYLRIVPADVSHKQLDIEQTVRRGKMVYLNNNVSRRNHEVITIAILDSVNFSAYSNGPAVRMNLSGHPTGVGGDVDTVFAYQCPAWPATEWPTRTRPLGWPKASVIHSTAAKGCHIIRKAHPLSDINDAEIEFRYSFSVAENDLCQTLTMVQRQCYILFRIIMIEALDSDGSSPVMLSSYHLKTVFLWLCERTSPEAWTRDTLVGCLLALLDQLLDFLNKSHIPNYVMPENNMINHLSQKDITDLYHIVTQVRTDPLRCYFGFYKKREFDRFIHKGMSLENLVKPILDAIGRDEYTQIVASIQSLQTVAFYLAEIGYWHRAGVYNEEISYLLRILGSYVSPVLLNSILFMLLDLLYRLENFSLCWPQHLNDNSCTVCWYDIKAPAPYCPCLEIAWDASKFLCVQGLDSHAILLLQKVVDLAWEKLGSQLQSSAEGRKCLDVEIVFEMLCLYAIHMACSSWPQ